MKKSKLLLVITLGLVLAMLTFTTNTFSWFNRPEEKSGNALELSLSSMPISTGGVSMSTQMLNESVEPTGNSVTDFSNNSGIARGDRVSYRTTLTNKSDTDQSVSLYISELSKITGGNFYLGVNDPLKTYKQYKITQAQPKKTDSNIPYSDGYMKNIFIAFNRNDFQNPNPNAYKFHYWGSEGNYDADFVKTNHSENVDGNYFDVYYATVPIWATKGQLWKPDSGDGTWYADTIITFSESNFLRVFNWAESDNGIAGAKENASRYKATPASIDRFYSSAVKGVNNTDMPLAANGVGTFTYNSDAPSIASIDATTGLLKGISVGNTTVHVTATGTWGNKITMDCAVEVYDNNVEAFDGTDVPIITNVKVPAPGDNSSGQVTIDWFIKNDGGSTMSYNIKSVYLTL